MQGHVGSGHQNGFVDPTSEKFAITSELEFFTERFLSSLQVFITAPVYVICVSQKFNICDLRAGQSRYLYIDILAYGKIMKCVLLQGNESKPLHSYRTMAD